MPFNEVRTWVIFYLISFVVLLLALFFTTQGIMLGIGLTLVIVVIVINFLIVYAEMKRLNERKAMIERFTKKDDVENIEDDEMSGFLL